ncbi:hypothetical protein C8R44DRAFT_368653 [Mycena epipterygia]|nr:hypothetical protein C8R44DRAFT_368653 [Mycena epipterygia]
MGSLALYKTSTWTSLPGTASATTTDTDSGTTATDTATATSTYATTTTTDLDYTEQATCSCRRLNPTGGIQHCTCAPSRCREPACASYYFL